MASGPADLARVWPHAGTSVRRAAPFSPATAYAERLQPVPPREVPSREVPAEPALTARIVPG